MIYNNNCTVILFGKIFAHPTDTLFPSKILDSGQVIKVIFLSLWLIKKEKYLLLIIFFAGECLYTMLVLL